MTDRRTIAALAVLVVLATGCERDSDASGRADTSVGSAVPITAREVVAPEGFARAVVGLESSRGEDEGSELDVWFAGDQQQRRRGLTGVTDLAGADGMLFAFDSAGEYRFYMWQTLMPLDIYFFDAERRFVGSDSMEPCLTGSSASCERYSPGEPFLLALEVPAGSLDALSIDGTWMLTFAASAPDPSLPPGPAPTDR